MYQISFVILHYISYETTCTCIDSIIATYPISPQITYQIIVVDNASPNNSYMLLKKRYQNLPYITFLRSTTNIGFAQGNNLGYQYAVQQFHSDFVIIANNDTEFIQSNFLSEMIHLYKKQSYAILGPDIQNISGFHQSPYRDHIISDKELTRWIRNRRLWLTFLQINKILKITHYIPFFQDYYKRRSTAGIPDSDKWSSEQHNVVLHGSCIIFSPLYITSSPQYAFYPDTFMYCEEDILAYICYSKNLPILYSPKLQILHKESVSTQLSIKDTTQKDLFLTMHILKSLKVYRKLRKQSRL